MRKSSQTVCRRLVWNDAGDTKYANVPILAQIAPDRFVDIVLRQPVTSQRTILSAFKSRYDFGALDGKLAAEKAWLVGVRDELLRKMEGASVASRLRVQQFIA